MMWKGNKIIYYYSIMLCGFGRIFKFCNYVDHYSTDFVVFSVSHCIVAGSQAVSIVLTMPPT